MGLTALPTEKASELLQVKCVTPTLLAHAAAARIEPAATPLGQAPGRAIYVAALSHLVSPSLALHEELSPTGLRIQALYPGIVATEFHERQGMDLSAVARMIADEVVTANLHGLDLGEVICAPGVAQRSLLKEYVHVCLAAFGGQSPQLATHYRQSPAIAGGHREGVVS